MKLKFILPDSHLAKTVFLFPFQISSESISNFGTKHTDIRAFTASPLNVYIIPVNLC